MLRRLSLRVSEYGLRKLLSGSITDDDLQDAINRLDRVIVHAQDVQRARTSNGSIMPLPMASYDGNGSVNISVMSSAAPWTTMHPPEFNIPCMISIEEKQYYSYIGKFYSGAGCAVELGPWLGASTRYIVNSLGDNPRFAGKRLHVFDDFLWRSSWMDEYLPLADRPLDHTSFRHLFDKHTQEIAEKLQVDRVKIVDYEGNESLPAFSWNRSDDIEFLYVDCGRTIEVNAAWYKIMRPAFIPGRTLIMMQDWRLHRQVPRLWYNQTLLFTQQHAHELTLVHEVSSGGLATFLYNPDG